MHENRLIFLWLSEEYFLRPQDGCMATNLYYHSLVNISIVSSYGVRALWKIILSACHSLVLHDCVVGCL